MTTNFQRQQPLTPKNLHTKHLLHQPSFALIGTKNFFTTTTVYTKTPFTFETFCTKQLLTPRNLTGWGYPALQTIKLLIIDKPLLVRPVQIVCSKWAVQDIRACAKLQCNMDKPIRKNPSLCLNKYVSPLSWYSTDWHAFWLLCPLFFDCAGILDSLQCSQTPDTSPKRTLNCSLFAFARDVNRQLSISPKQPNKMKLFTHHYLISFMVHKKLGRFFTSTMILTPAMPWRNCLYCDHCCERKVRLIKMSIFIFTSSTSTAQGGGGSFKIGNL